MGQVGYPGLRDSKSTFFFKLKKNVFFKTDEAFTSKNIKYIKQVL